MTAPIDTDRSRQSRAGGIAAAIAAISVVGTSLGLGMPLLSILLEERGYSSIVIGLNTAVAGLAAVLVAPFVPGLARRVGSGFLLLMAVIVGTAVFPLFYVFSSLAVWFGLRFAFTLAINTIFVLSEFWINALAPPGRRGLVMGLYATVLSVGFAVGPAILALVGSDGWLPFAVGTALMAIAILPIVFGLGADPEIEIRQGRNVLHFLSVVPLSTLAALAMGAVESSVMSFAPVYGLRLGYPEEVAALLVMSVAIGNIVAQLPLGIVSDHMDRRLMLALIGLVSSLLAVVSMAVSGSPSILMVTLGVFGGLYTGLYVVGLTHLGTRVSGGELASANAAFLMMYSVGMLIGPGLTGLGMDAAGPQGFLCVNGLFLFAFGLFAIVRFVGARRGGTPEADRST